MEKKNDCIPLIGKNNKIIGFEEKKKSTKMVYYIVQYLFLFLKKVEF
ncbi:hypothetical protein [Blattabacterium cuenoti]|nr:hypothetical protein [Blattabacterium cuenoti]